MPITIFFFELCYKHIVTDIIIDIIIIIFIIILNN